MNRLLALLRCAVLCVATSALPALAQGTPGTMFSDLWGDPSEIGWGVTIDHQVEVMFLTFYIYKGDNTPYWVNALLARTTTGSGVVFPLTFTGDLYETSASYYGGTWNNAQGTRRKVGTATFTANSIVQATLSYTIDGVTVNKTIQRTPLRNVNFTGLYLGGLFYLTSGCASSAQNGQTVIDSGAIAINQNGAAIVLQAQGSSRTCTFTGTYTQIGQLGSVDGTFSCTDGAAGPFGLRGVQWTIYGMTAGLVGATQSCSFEGAFGGITPNHLSP